MTAGIPKERSIELLKMFGDMLISKTPIIEMDYWRYAKELEKIGSADAMSALGILHAVAGQIEKSSEVFEKALENFDDPTIAHNYCFVLNKTNQNELHFAKVYEFADRFATKRLTYIAYNFAYRFGDVDALVKYMDQHIKLLSVEEGRELAEKHKAELLEELSYAYQESGCSKEQFHLIAHIMWNIVQRYDADTGLVSVSNQHSRAYVLDILDLEPKKIAEMNYSLAEAICMEPLLDDCELVARFSPKRELHTGVTYVNPEF